MITCQCGRKYNEFRVTRCPKCGASPGGGATRASVGVTSGPGAAAAAPQRSSSNDFERRMLWEMEKQSKYLWGIRLILWLAFLVAFVIPFLLFSIYRLSS